MFSNYAQFSRQVGVNVGTLPPGSAGGGMSSPSFGRRAYSGQDLYFTDNNSPGGYGAAAVGGFGNAIPSVASGMALAGGLGLMGRMGTYMDPFTMVGRSFAGGMGTSGFMGSARALGGAFSNGGLIGGASMLSGGLAAAALPFAAYSAAGAGVDFVGSNVYQGAQNMSQVTSMAGQFFQPTYGQSGARPGGVMGRDQLKQVVGVLREVASDETMASMSDVMQLMNKAGQMGMFSNVGNAQQFGDKFKKIVSQVKEVAKIMGTSLDEAMPVFGQMQHMGMWRTSDVMGTALAMKTVGPNAAPQLLQTMEMGSQRSYAMGGSLTAGATLARNQFMNVQAAMQSGVFTTEQLKEATGGIGGPEGERMLAERLTGALQNMSQTPVGRLSMAALGEVKDGRYTGKIDQDRLGKMMSGQLSVQDLQSQGMANTRTREGAASFTFKEDQLGQELMAKGGVEGLAQMFQMGLNKAGFGGASDEIQGIMLQKMSGMNRRDAEFIQKIIRDLPTIQERRSRREMDSLRDAFQQAEEKQNRSWQGFKEAVEQVVDDKMRAPIQQVAERMTQGINEGVDKLTDWVWGRRTTLNVTGVDRMRGLAKGAFGRGGSGLRNDLMGGQLADNMDTTITDRVRRSGSVFDAMGAAADNMLGFESGLGTRASALVDAGAPVVLRDKAGAGEITAYGGSSLGMTGVITSESARNVIERVRRRAMSPTTTSLFSSADADKNIAVVQRGLASVLGSAKNIAELQRLKKEKGPGAYAAALANMVRQQDPMAARAMDALGGGMQSDLDALAVAQEKNGSHFLNADLKTLADNVDPSLFTMDSKKMEQFINKGVSGALGVLKEGGNQPTPEQIERMSRGAGAMRSDMLGMSDLRQGGGVDVGISETQLKDALNSEAGDELVAWAAAGGGSMDNMPKLRKAMEENGDKTIQTIVTRLSEQSKTDPSALKRFAQSGGNVGLARDVKITQLTMQDRSKLASRELDGMGSLRGLSGGSQDTYRRILEGYKSMDPREQERAGALAEQFGAGLSAEERSVLRGAGSIGRQIYGFGAVNSLGAVGMEKNSFMNELQRSGLAEQFAQIGAIDPAKAREFESFFSKGSAGGAGLSLNELTKIRDEIRKNNKNNLAETTQSREKLQNEMAASLAKFADSSEKFVLAVSTALPNIDTLAVENMRKNAALNEANATQAMGRE